MANDKKRFRRKLSAEEARGRFITVQKRELDFFPKVGKPFKLKVGRKSSEVYVGAVECWCQGPQKPHSHYRIELGELAEQLNLHWGSKLQIEKQGDLSYQILS